MKKAAFTSQSEDSKINISEQRKEVAISDHPQGGEGIIGFTFIKFIEDRLIWRRFGWETIEGTKTKHTEQWLSINKEE